VTRVWQIRRDAFARALRGHLFVTSRVRESTLRLFSALALASAMLLGLFGAAQAQTATTTTLVITPSPAAAGGPVTFSATVTPAVTGAQTPTGTVTFTENGNTIATGTLVADGTVSIANGFAPLKVGTHTITASYPGDGNFGASTGSATVTVNTNDTKSVIIASPNPSTTGQNVSFNVVISPATPTVSTFFPTGTVKVFDNGNLIGTATLSSLGENSSAVVVTSALTPGSHSITSSYAGDGQFNGSTGSVTQTVNPPAQTNTSLAIAASPKSSVFTQSVTFTVTISSASGTGIPTGTVTFSDGITTIGSATASAGPLTGESTATL
jgi:hypothetical protein